MSAFWNPFHLQAEVPLSVCGQIEPSLGAVQSPGCIVHIHLTLAVSNRFVEISEC